MSATIAQALVLQLEANGYPKGVHLTLGLDNGMVCRGTVVSPEQWADENRRAGWTDAFQYPLPHVPAHTMIHMIEVEYLSGGAWVPGGNISVDTDRVVMMGDQH